jgi:orotidine-5'-phosphate decarboxylase
VKDRLIVALDLPSTSEAEAMTARCGEAVSFYKIGLQLLPVGGMDLCKGLRAQGKKVFLDFKLHDIPTTVEKATRSIASRGGDLLTVHAEPPVMEAAVRGRGNDPDLKLLGVTVLTSYDDAMLKEIGYAFSARDLVMRRVRQALDCGMDGVVASPLEAQAIRAEFGDRLLIVTPGIRPSWSSKDDQARAATPADALRNGATHLVVGRPINAADDPAEAARKVLAEMEAA